MLYENSEFKNILNINAVFNKYFENNNTNSLNNRYAFKNSIPLSYILLQTHENDSPKECVDEYKRNELPKSWPNSLTTRASFTPR